MPQRQSARTKTFTGCWTCRQRRVKCDERRPTCQQCDRRNAKCQGYAARLQWLKPTTHEDGGAAQPQGLMSEPSLYSRRQIPPAVLSYAAILSDTELDDVLAQFDGLDASRHPTIRGPFGVFTALPTSASPIKSVSPSPVDNTEFSEAEPTPERLSGFEPLGLTDRLQDCSSSASEYSVSGHSTGQASDCETPCTLDLSFYQPRQYLLSTRDGYLLQHYAQKAVKVFSVIDNEKSLWRTFHLPRALQSTAESAVLGSSPMARNSLLQAVLSVSAYVLSNSHEIEGRADEAQKWANIGLKLKYQAIQYLKEAINPVTGPYSRPKYKELLVAMLSMISIDVVSGDTTSCSLHLAGCERLIRSTRNIKTKYSSKARALHRIFFYLDTMHLSTDLFERRRPVTQGSSGGAFFYQDDYLEWLDMTEDPGLGPTSYEYIYGIPLSLLALMRRVVYTIRKLEADARETPSGGTLSPQLSNLCDQVETEVLEWPVEDSIAEVARRFPDSSFVDVIEHQTKAFHSALIIYFSRKIRHMHRFHLQQYVRTILHHLEAVEVLKDAINLNTGPIFWPAFIGASEAVDPDLQARITAWFSNARKYGVQAAWMGFNVAALVWTGGRIPESTTTSKWRAVAAGQSVHLMLT